MQMVLEKPLPNTEAGFAEGGEQERYYNVLFHSVKLNGSDLGLNLIYARGTLFYALYILKSCKSIKF